MTEKQIHHEFRLRLAVVLKEARKDQTYASFSKILGIGAGTLFRLENKDQSITLDTLSRIMARLDLKLSDLFPEL